MRIKAKFPIRYKFLAKMSEGLLGGETYAYDRLVKGTCDEDGNLEFPIETRNLVEKMVSKLVMMDYFPDEISKITNLLMSRLEDMEAYQMERGVILYRKDYSDEVPFMFFQLKWVQ